jgi:hypothetical protein
MLSRRLRYFRFHFKGRGGSWLALVGQVIAVVGLPLPAASAKDVSRPFPCQHRACGCLSAGDCWTSCCCFTAAQRVAWAQEHDAEVPQTLVEQAEQEAAAHECGEGECSDVRAKPCCTKHSQPPVKPKAASSKQTGWLVVIQARRCQGAAGDEGDVSPTLSPAAPHLWRYEWVLVASLPVESTSAETIADLPPAPPPRG